MTPEQFRVGVYEAAGYPSDTEPEYLIEVIEAYRVALHKFLTGRGREVEVLTLTDKGREAAAEFRDAH